MKQVAVVMYSERRVSVVGVPTGTELDQKLKARERFETIEGLDGYWADLLEDGDGLDDWNG